MPDKNTQQLEHDLSQAENVAEFLQENQSSLQEFTLAGYLAHLLKEKRLSKAAIVQASGLERTYAYHIFAGKKKPSRPKILAIALAMQLTPKEAQYLLHYAGVSQLYVRDAWDSVIWAALERQQSVTATNILLTELNQPPLLE